MTVNYNSLYSKNVPANVETHAGLMAQTKYVFSVTNADPSTLALDGLADAMRIAMRNEGDQLGPYPPQLGHVGLRQHIVENFKAKRGADVNIFLTSGAGGAIDTFFNAFIDPGDVVLIEEYSYLGSLRMLLERRADVRHVPTDENGMNTEALEDMVRSLVQQGKPPKLIYTISVYQNPMGVTLSLERRKHMIEISQKYGVPIFENESYADFRIDGDDVPPAMIGMDDSDSVIYVSSFTKLMGCALRLGYAAFPELMRQRLTMLKFGTRPSHLPAMVLAEYFREHKEEHLDEVRNSLRQKRDAMLAALGENFPSSCTWTKPTGGMMLWVTLPEGADSWKALDSAVEAGVKYNPGGVFRAKRDGNNRLRLTYSHNSPQEIHDGISVLADVFQKEGLFG